jgi:hypothetical protein
MKKSDVKVGMNVTCKHPVAAYYSSYPKGSPSCTFEPGDVGVVAALDVPTVMTTHGKASSFVCVDFLKPGAITNAAHGGGLWRVGLRYDNLIPLSSTFLLKRFQVFEYGGDQAISVQHGLLDWQVQFMSEGMNYRPTTRATRDLLDSTYPGLWVPQSAESMLCLLQSCGFVCLHAESNRKKEEERC